jgi:large subunit ribosomal protein L18
MDIAKTRIIIRKSRHNRIRRSISGTQERPRLVVRRSLAHIYAQLVNDTDGISVAQVSSLNKDIQQQIEGKTKTDVAKLVGQKIAEMGKDKGVASVVFDRGGRLYHGRVKALAEAARQSGLKF